MRTRKSLTALAISSALALAAAAGDLRAAFPADEDAEERAQQGRDPGYLEEVSSMAGLHQGAEPVRPSVDLAGSLLALATKGDQAPPAAAARKPENPIAGGLLERAEEGPGPKTWHVVVFFLTLGLASLALWRYRGPTPDED